MNDFPKEYLFTDKHVWIHKLKNGRIQIGLTDYLLSWMGFCTEVEFPRLGQKIEMGNACAHTKFTEYIYEVTAPVNGIVSAVNEELHDSPFLINEAPYTYWLIEIKPDEFGEDYLTAAGYAALLGEQ
jgi:glycine cleavage system H protein